MRWIASVVGKDIATIAAFVLGAGYSCKYPHQRSVRAWLENPVLEPSKILLLLVWPPQPLWDEPQPWLSPKSTT